MYFCIIISLSKGTFSFIESREDVREIPNELDVIVSENRLSEESSNHMKKNHRGTWNEVQKTMMLQFFKNHIKKETAPRKGECLEFREKNLENFQTKSWLQIKTFVYNSYRVH